MCHADISLSASGDYVSFNNHTEGEKCRDLNAIQEWAGKHSWPGYAKYLDDVVGFNAREVESTLKTEAGKGPWYKVHSKIDKMTGKIEVWYDE